MKTTPPLGEQIFNKHEREQQLAKMRVVSDTFYYSAIKINVHAFIEFCGLMNKFIDICERTSDAGVDFNTANRHVGQALKVETHDIEYLAEKFECIFGATFEGNPELKALFIKKAFS